MSPTHCLRVKAEGPPAQLPLCLHLARTSPVFICPCLLEPRRGLASPRHPFGRLHPRASFAKQNQSSSPRAASFRSRACHRPCQSPHQISTRLARAVPLPDPQLFFESRGTLVLVTWEPCTQRLTFDLWSPIGPRIPPAPCQRSTAHCHARE